MHALCQRPCPCAGTVFCLRRVPVGAGLCSARVVLFAAAGKSTPRPGAEHPRFYFSPSTCCFQNRRTDSYSTVPTNPAMVTPYTSSVSHVRLYRSFR